MVAATNQATTDIARGLTEQEAAARHQKPGYSNNVKLKTSRSYAEILRSNILNPINIILFSIGTVMVLIGRTGDAVTSVGLIVLNIVIGIYQEIRAKRQLDEIALLTRPRVTIIRDGAEKVVDPTEVVLGDILVANAGDQIVVDGVVVGDSKIDVDESLLTGEADLISKSTGDEVLSGSFVVTGRTVYEATRVGEASFANKLTANAREFQMAMTPLQREINFILRLLLLLAGFIGFLIAISTILSAVPFMRQVQMAAVIAGLIPNGLFFMVILAYAMGALRIVQRGALVQQSNAVESLSNVTVLCTDKTGTLTANRINYNDVFPVGISKAEFETLLGDFARSASSGNKTSDALIKGVGGTKRTPVDEVPFSSARKWSAIAFDDSERRGVYVMGALAMLDSHMSVPAAVREQMDKWSEQGLRVLVFGHNPDVTTLHPEGEDSDPILPQLAVTGAISFSDELRPQLKETIRGFLDNGIALKVISGDSPRTVAALARQAGLPGDLKYVSGPEIETMDMATLRKVASETTVFGRITPDQKEKLVEALQAEGNYVAMIGDGVNDVLSLKKADMGIAMESGSSATRSVADMILLNDSFGALPPAFTEGQRIVNGMKDILRLFLTRVLYSALLILATSIIGIGFPFLPKHNALIVFLTVGIPTLALAVWARPGKMPRGGMLREIAHFVIPAGFSIMVFGLIVYFMTFAGYLLGTVTIMDTITPAQIDAFEEYAGLTYDLIDQEEYIVETSHLAAQTALTIFTTLAGLILLVFVEPPTQYFVAGDEYSGDWRPALLAVGMLIVFIVVLVVEPIRTFFEMVPLPWYSYLLIVLTTVIWMLTLRLAWRGKWLQRFLGVDLPSGLELEIKRQTMTMQQV